MKLHCDFSRADGLLAPSRANPQTNRYHDGSMTGNEQSNGAQTLLIDADDTLWENNIYFERAIARFISFLNHRRIFARPGPRNPERRRAGKHRDPRLRPAQLCARAGG